MTEFVNTTQQSKRDRVKTILRALLAKTVANGCTEQEATKAAEKAAELMAEYNISAESAQEVQDDVYGNLKKAYGEPNRRAHRFHEATDVMGAVAVFTGTKTYYDGHQICFFGAKHDCEIAHWLLSLFINCSEADWQALRKKRGTDTSIRGRKSFFRGFVHRMRARLTEIRIAREQTQEREQAAKAREAIAAGASQNDVAARRVNALALVDLKKEVVKERFEKHTASFGGLGKAKGGNRVYDRYSGNYDQGRASANRVNITQGVGASSNARIGR